MCGLSAKVYEDPFNLIIILRFESVRFRRPSHLSAPVTRPEWLAHTMLPTVRPNRIACCSEKPSTNLRSDAAVSAEI